MKNHPNKSVAVDWLKQEVSETATELLAVLAERARRHPTVRVEHIIGIARAALSDADLVVQRAGVMPVQDDASHPDMSVYENSLKNRQSTPAEPASCPKPEQPTKRKWQRKTKPAAKAEVVPGFVLSAEPQQAAR